MKYINLIILICFFTINIHSQCLDAPNIHFVGSKVEWALGTVDTFVKRTCIKYIYQDEAFFTLNDPIEASDKIIYSLSNIKYGTIVQAISTIDGSIAWKNHYNSTTQNGYGYNYYMDITSSSANKIILNGTRYPIKTNNVVNTDFGGHLAERFIDINNGNDIFEQVIDSEIAYYISSSQFHKKQGKKNYFYCNLLGSNFYVNGNNYRCVYRSADFDQNIIEPTKGDTLYFNSRDDDGFPNPPQTKGPFLLKDSLYTYLTQYNKNGKFHQFIWSVNIDGHILQFKEISDKINTLADETYFVDAKQQGDDILLTTVTLDESYEGNYGYIVVSHDGTVKKDNSAMTIDNKKAGFMSVVKLKDSDEYLIATRLQGQNDIFFYRETAKDTYIEAAHLINPNRSVYAFCPYNLLQTKDYGVVLTGSFLLDTFKLGSITPFQAGGWPVIMKLSAETLGLPTSTINVHPVANSFSIAPNPTLDQLSITIPETLLAKMIQITDQTGKILLTVRLNEKTTQLNISHLNAGLHFIYLTNENGKRIGDVKKLVKI